MACRALADAPHGAADSRSRYHATDKRPGKQDLLDNVELGAGWARTPSLRSVGQWTGWLERITLSGSTVALMRRSRWWASPVQRVCGSRLVSAKFMYACPAAQGPRASITISMWALTRAAASGVGAMPTA